MHSVAKCAPNCVVAQQSTKQNNCFGNISSIDLCFTVVFMTNAVVVGVAAAGIVFLVGWLLRMRRG